MKGAVGGRSDRKECWHRWGWTSLCLDQMRVVEVDNAGFLEAAVVEHILGVLRSLDL